MIITVSYVGNKAMPGEEGSKTTGREGMRISTCQGPAKLDSGQWIRFAQKGDQRLYVLAYQASLEYLDPWRRLESCTRTRQCRT
jgi:hypothetical protein